MFLPPARDSLRFLFIVVAEGQRERSLESRLYVEKEFLTIYAIGERSEERDSDLTTKGKKRKKERK